jgi:teichuronic acid biosynthesis glycosyltransferase TuaG
MRNVACRGDGEIIPDEFERCIMCFTMQSRIQDNSVTVIIPTYSRAKSTVVAVHSALNQTLKPSRIIVIDDGSPEDDFSDLRTQLAGLPVELIKGEKSSHPGRARNIGLAMSTSQWIAFLDSDDLWEPDKLKIQIDYASSQKAQAICTNASILDGNNSGGILYPSLPRILTTKKLIKSNYIINSSVLISRDLLIQVGGISAEYSVRGVEDYSTWLKTSRFVNWHVINEPLVLYAQFSEDSIRIGSQLNHYSRVYAWLDYASWSKEYFGEKQLLTRIILKMLSILIGK